MAMNRWQSLQALRGLAALAVVAFHLQSIERKYSGGDLLLPDFLVLGQSGVDLFFVISGFVMVSVSSGRFGRSRETTRFLWGRLTRIYPAYWVYFLLTLAVFVVKPEWVNSSQDGQVGLLSSFLLLPGSPPLVAVSWSLTHELWFYIVFAALLRFQQRWLLPSLLLWAAVVATANIVSMPADLPALLVIAFHPFSIEFIIGALAAVFINSKHAHRISTPLSTSAAVLVMAAGLPLLYSFDVLSAFGLARACFVGTLCGVLILAVANLEKSDRIVVPRFLSFLGDISYTVYLSHVLVLSAIGRLWAMTGPAPGSSVDNVLACLLMLAAVVIYAWAGYRFVEEPILRVSHQLRERWFDPSR
jgi:exopolysaccharide production protein ExoZ